MTSGRSRLPADCGCRLCCSPSLLCVCVRLLGRGQGSLPGSSSCRRGGNLLGRERGRGALRCGAVPGSAPVPRCGAGCGQAFRGGGTVRPFPPPQPGPARPAPRHPRPGGARAARRCAPPGGTASACPGSGGGRAAAPGNCLPAKGTRRSSLPAEHLSARGA